MLLLNLVSVNNTTMKKIIYSLIVFICFALILSAYFFFIQKSSYPPDNNEFPETTVQTNSSASSVRKIISDFPKAKQGFERNIILLPERINEQDLKIELQIGKTISVDCNNHWFYGSFEEKTVEGFGYTYYELENIKGPASTLMGCGNKPQENSFVPVTGDFLYRYNSRMPFVIYMPDGFDVKFRILKPEGIFETATE